MNLGKFKQTKIYTFNFYMTVNDQYYCIHGIETACITCNSMCAIVSKYLCSKSIFLNAKILILSYKIISLGKPDDLAQSWTEFY